MHKVEYPFFGDTLFDAVQHGMEHHILISGQFIIQRGILKDNPDGMPDMILLGKRTESIYPGLASRRAQQRRKHLDGRRFACTVRSEEREDLSRIDVKRDIIDSSQIAEFFRQMVYIYDVFLHFVYDTI